MSAHQDLAREVLSLARERGMKLAMAESCTGGMVAAALTDIAGSSDVVDRGFVTYSNQAKHEMLGVSNDTLETFGAVSRQTAQEMAEGALTRSQADIAISITGIAGPGGGSEEKPVGLVWFGLASKNGVGFTAEEQFSDMDRSGVRAASVEVALRLFLDALS